MNSLRSFARRQEECESCAFGPLGPVAEHESIARVVVSPHHFNKKGEVRIGAFPKMQILKAGISVLRASVITEESLEEIGKFIAQTLPHRNGEPGTYAGALLTQADSLRALRDNVGRRDLFVVDDPILDCEGEPDNLAHAILIASEQSDEIDALRIQQELVQLFSERRTPA